MKLTLGELVDRLTITNLKIWHQEDRKRDMSLADSQRLAAADRVNALNRQRNELMEAIDDLLPQGRKFQKFPDYEGEDRS